MEQVEGSTLRQWLVMKERGWEEILGVMTAAGQGLAAAHRAGLVHRDFKPENVLVGEEEDGKVVVSDFGLAGASDDWGTREYMAPEQSSARADLFAFCVTFWEALHGERPAWQGSPPQLPAVKRAPGWVYAALMGGLAVSPDDRWPSMEALLAELRRPVRWGLVLGVAGTAAAAIAVAAFLAGRGGVAPSCDDAEEVFASAWGEERKEGVRGAFLASGSPLAAATWPKVEAALDEHARTWQRLYTDTCRARVARRQSEALLDLRTECLLRRRGVVSELTELWSKGMTAEDVDGALDGSHGLPQLAPCADARALTGRAPMPSDPMVERAVMTARQQLDSVQALLLANHSSPALVMAAVARVAAEATGWPQVRAEVALLEGRVLTSLSDAGAEPRLLEAARLAGEAQDHRLAAEAVVELVQHFAEDQQRADQAILAADLAEGLVARAGGDPMLRVPLLRFRGAALRTKGENQRAKTVLEEARRLSVASAGEEAWLTRTVDGELARVAEVLGDHAEARRLGEQVVAAAIARFSPDHPRVAAHLNNLAVAFESGGDPEAARDFYRRALAIKRRTMSERSTSMALTLNNLGAVEISLGDLDEAQRLLERALEIRLELLGPEHAYVATTLGNLAIVHRRRGDVKKALELAERALEIKRKRYGEAHANVANSTADLGRLHAISGELSVARGYFQRTYETRIQVLGFDHEKTRRSRNQLAGALLALRQVEEARALLQLNLETIARSAAPDRENQAEAEALMADLELREGQGAQVLPRLLRAQALLADAKVEVAARGLVRCRLGRALHAAGKRVEAVAAMREAKRELATAALEPEIAQSLAATTAWLAAHDRQR